MLSSFPIDTHECDPYGRSILTEKKHHISSKCEEVDPFSGFNNHV
jgi:hypothetical protein